MKSTFEYRHTSKNYCFRFPGRGVGRDVAGTDDRLYVGTETMEDRVKRGSVPAAWTVRGHWPGRSASAHVHTNSSLKMPGMPCRRSPSLKHDETSWSSSPVNSADDSSLWSGHCPLAALCTAHSAMSVTTPVIRPTDTHRTLDGHI